VCFYVTCLIFIFAVLGPVSRLCGFSLLKLMRYMREEILVCLATTSSETVMPRTLIKLENLGCKPSVVGLIIPTGYSFNLDGTCLYLATVTVFLAQATNTPLDLYQQLVLLAVLLLTSKGAAGVAGRRLRGAGGDLVDGGRHTGGQRGADPRRAPAAVGGPDADQPDRQRGGDHRHLEMGRRARRGTHAPRAEPGSLIF
jgi:hypothetical protein